MNFNTLLILSFFLAPIISFSQTTEKESVELSLNKGKIENQFDYVISKSYRWDKDGINYRMVEASWLSDLKAHTLDSLRSIRKNLMAYEITISDQKQEISDLKKTISIKQNHLESSKNEQHTISFLGASIHKTTYSLLVWFIIFILLVLLMLFIYKFKNSNTVTQEARRMLTELEDEFETHRKTAVEREQKVRRQLLDEINKQKIIKPKK